MQRDLVVKARDGALDGFPAAPVIADHAFGAGHSGSAACPRSTSFAASTPCSCSVIVFGLVWLLVTDAFAALYLALVARVFLDAVPANVA